MIIGINITHITEALKRARPASMDTPTERATMFELGQCSAFTSVLQEFAHLLFPHEHEREDRLRWMGEVFNRKPV